MTRNRDCSRGFTRCRKWLARESQSPPKLMPGIMDATATSIDLSIEITSSEASLFEEFDRLDSAPTGTLPGEWQRLLDRAREATPMMDTFNVEVSTSSPGPESAHGSGSQGQVTDDGLYGLRQTREKMEQHLRGCELIRTAGSRPKLLVSRTGSLSMWVVPRFKQILGDAITQLEDMSQPVSSRFAAGLVLETLVGLIEEKVRNGKTPRRESLRRFALVRLFLTSFATMRRSNLRQVQVAICGARRHTAQSQERQELLWTHLN